MIIIVKLDRFIAGLLVIASTLWNSLEQQPKLCRQLFCFLLGIQGIRNNRSSFPSGPSYLKNNFIQWIHRAVFN